MSVLIKGMEMPTCCAKCPAFHDTLRCGITDFPFYSGARHERRMYDCPLVPVPPHGRLIDALWVREQIIKQWMDYSDDSHMYKRGMEDAYEVIRNAPTIIPAEEAHNGE